MRTIFFTTFCTLLLCIQFDGCLKDAGNPVAALNSPLITSIVPDSGAVGDTVHINGKNFGTTRGTSSASFGSIPVANYVSWSDTLVTVRVPASAATSSVIITVGSTSSNSKQFTVIGTAALISFKNDVLPIFTSRCIGCHGGTNNLFLDSYSNVMKGNSNHGPVVTPGNGESSIIILKLRGLASFGSRMPLGGPYLADSTIALVSLWIAQGARNN